MNVNEFFTWAEERYFSSTPSAKKIRTLLKDEGELIVNDHIALRTFNFKGINVSDFGAFFENLGYVKKDSYEFPAKKVQATHYEKIGFPKVFISELLVEKLSLKSQDIIKKVISEIPKGTKVEELFLQKRLWGITTEDYKLLAKESEYASWVYAWGFEPNHFTVLVNKLKKFDQLEKLNKFLKEKGFILNSSGGEIKGSPEVYLEQSSTMADKSVVEFNDGKLEVPSCYYEFAFRHNKEDGKRFEGFVSSSADKIFESTNELGR
ncbi:MAG: succinyldiaminopimelate aminotransferase [Halobacteriovorax sp.]|nr:succinyldiaminopimelate aminotransferase [Halobacteriovorax sp.]|tara:strand:- start:98641 stop:99432 length:792 start_codon:yes stop_codon:yes gene_type:complete